MNRTIALFLALAVLSAHALAIYQANNGDLAPPYDIAHVAYRVGRNLAQTGRMAWDSSLSSDEVYPSTLWVLVAAVAEHTSFSVTYFTQALGAVSALATVLVVAYLSPHRLAGVIAPLLLVVSGGLASSALSGTEIPFATLAVSVAFLAFERRWRRPFGLALALVVLARPEGAVFAAGLFALELWDRARARGETGLARRSLAWAFLPAALAACVLVALRFQRTGQLLSPTLQDMLAPDGERLRRGVAFACDLLVGYGAPFLVVFPIWYAARGFLRGTGLRALILALVWGAALVAGGGGVLPFAGEMVPVLPLLYVSIQEAMTLALDSSKRGLPQLSWALFVLGMLSSALASKYPGDLGPLPVAELHRSWQTGRGPAGFGRSRSLGRLGLDEEIKLTERLRAAGLFLRDHIDPTYSILSPWPGAIGYLSQMRVLDPLGRATRLPQLERVRPWTSAVRSDLLAVLEEGSEYIVPTMTTSGQAPSMDDLVESWMGRLDGAAQSPERTSLFVQALARYEMIAVPLEYEHQTPSGGAAVFFLLRRRDLGLAPQLSASVERDGRFEVTLEHDSHEQLVDLRVEARDRAGKAWFMRPTGEFTADAGVLARTHILLFPTGNRSVRVAHGQIPAELQACELRVALRNPSARGADPFTTVGNVFAVSF